MTDCPDDIRRRAGHIPKRKTDRWADLNAFIDATMASLSPRQLRVWLCLFRDAGKDKGRNAPFANHEICKLDACAPKSIDDVSWLTEWRDDYEFAHVEDSALAKRTALKMRKWLPLWGIGNGDCLCLDASADPSPVLFNKHDWYDGGSGGNGHKIAESLIDFYSDWARVCFQFPSRLWWAGVFNKNGEGIDWASDEFREPFRLTTGQ
jgi:hypothetical protein